MIIKKECLSTLPAVLLMAGLLSTASVSRAETLIGSDLNSASSSDSAIAELYSGNRGSNGGGDQSLQQGDSLTGTADNDVLIGGLGVDVLFGGEGDDVLIGGTEDFNPLNRDRAFGGQGDDSFVWAPGDGNDFFDGGDGVDVLFMALIGESTDADGNTAGAPFFGVSPPNTTGAANFDGIHLVDGEPILNIAGGPGFCEIAERDTDNDTALTELNLDHLVRFVLRGPRANFDNAVAADPDVDANTLDTGLRVAVHLKSVEFLVCGSQAGGEVKVFDLQQVPAQEVDVSQLPPRAQQLASP
ncbi:MAG: hypothetical protein AB8B48_05480 [Pseudomonadales bacterium]